MALLGLWKSVAFQYRPLKYCSLIISESMYYFHVASALLLEIAWYNSNKLAIYYRQVCHCCQGIITFSRCPIPVRSHNPFFVCEALLRKLSPEIPASIVPALKVLLFCNNIKTPSCKHCGHGRNLLNNRFASTYRSQFYMLTLPLNQPSST